MRYFAALLAPILALVCMLAPASAQQPVACSNFTDFPLSLNMGAPPLGIGGESYRCLYQKTQDAINAAATRKLDKAGGTMTGPVVLSPGSTGPIDGMSVTPTGGAETRTVSGWLGDLSGALTYVPTLSAKLTLATWLDVPARPQWWGAKCDGTTIDTTAMASAISGATSVGLRLRIAGTCLTAPLDVGSGAKIDAVQSGGLKLSGATGPILRIAGGADDVVIDGLAFDWTSTGAAAGDLTTSAIGQTPGSSGGRVRITYNRFKAVNLNGPAVNNHAVILNGAISTVHGNHVEGTAGDALNFNGGFNTVSANYVGYSRDGCVAFNNGARGVVTGNTLIRCHLAFGAGPEGNTADADQQQSMQFVGNLVEGCYNGVNMGWYGYAGREGPTNWTVAGNVFRNCQSVAINYDGRALGWQANGAIIGNVVTGTGASDFDGTLGGDTSDIRIANGSGVTISANRMSAPRGTGTRRAVYLIGSRDVIAQGNTINGSLDQTTNAGTTSANVNRYGTVFDLTDAQGSKIADNTARFGGYFAKFDQNTAGGPYDLTITGNSALDMNVHGIFSQKAGSGLIVVNNIVRATNWALYLPSTLADFTVTANVLASTNNLAIAADGGTANWTNFRVINNVVGGGAVPSGAN